MTRKSLILTSALALMIGAASAKAQDGPEAPFVDMSVMTGTPLADRSGGSALAPAAQP